MATVHMEDPRRARPRETHYQLARTGLHELLCELAAGGETRLPPEDKLAATLGFSRPTVRSALLSLQSEGKVHRVHGLGTFINRHALSMASVGANLAEDRPFLDVIEALGHDASVEILRLAVAPLPTSVLDRLRNITGYERNGGRGTFTNGERPASADGVIIERLFRASGRPAVLSRDLVPLDRMVMAPEQLSAGRSTFAFLSECAGVKVRYSVARLRAVGAAPDVAASLRMDPGTPVLLLDHLHLDEDDRPVGVTEAYLDQEVIPVSQVRTSDEL